MIGGHIEYGYTKSIENATKNPFLSACYRYDITFIEWCLRAGNLPTPETLETCLIFCSLSGLVDVLSLVLPVVSLKKEYRYVIQKRISRMCVVRDDEITKLIFKSGFVPTDIKLLGWAYHNANWCILEHLLVVGVRTDYIRFYRIKNRYEKHHDREALRRMLWVFTGIYDVLFNIIWNYLLD